MLKRPVAELLATVSAHELGEWMAFFKVEAEEREIARLGEEAARKNATRIKAWQGR